MSSCQNENSKMHATDWGGWILCQNLHHFLLYWNTESAENVILQLFHGQKRVWITQIILTLVARLYLNILTATKMFY